MNSSNSHLKRSGRLLSGLACFLFLVCISFENLHAQSQTVTKLPIKKDRFNRIFIPVKIDKDSLSLLFSTASRTLRLTPYFMETRTLYPGGGILAIKDKKGRSASRMIFYLPKLDIGNLKFRNEETIVNYAFPDSVITGTTGTLLVYQYNWKIDNDRNEVSLSKIPFTAEQPFIQVKYKNDNAPQAPVKIGELTDNFLIDFGSGTNFQVNANTVLGKQLISSYELKPVVTLTSNIHSRKLVDTIYEVTVPSLYFNGVELKDQKITLSTAAPKNVIGTALLGKYNVILNNSRKRKIDSELILEKRLVQ
ncbi:hypothetical protein ACSBL2_16100 [Pedobacter sp. AW31-3R]|uniref:hypothetical protein n=1 Tax=Pedobacter sp. AW31-3R TaxID=3445781 RepID=UPI003FA03659